MYPEGFLYSSARAGIKQKEDIGLILCNSEKSVSAGIFTKNKFGAACVKHSQNLLKTKNIKALLVNSGIANACTGKEGMENLISIIKELGRRLKINENVIAMSSTGVIGKQLPVKKIKNVFPELIRNLKKSCKGFSKAILTTDTIEKKDSISFKLNNKKVNITGICKGSGMIHPDMATMLCFITTDVNITKLMLKKALFDAAADSFNNLSVDGDSSTNDSVYAISSLLAGNKLIKSYVQKEYGIFMKNLKKLCLNLARKIVLDGEGATKFVKINVTKAKTREHAHKAARAVATSQLVKTALFGQDANWGRIIAAVGASGADVKEDKLILKINGRILFKNGAGIKTDKKYLHKIMTPKIINIDIILNTGMDKTEYMTCDLSYDYIRINAEYHT